MSRATKLLPFENVVEDVSAGNKKVQKGDYLSTGLYPVVDQGQSFVGGFSNDESDLVDGDGPWIVFGDHTRVLKYVDFPFCMGADGVKVLKPRSKDAIDTKYLFHFLNSSEIPSAGYSRHFKFLKRLEIPIPPLDNQRRIAAILDGADALRRKCMRSLDLLNSLTRSIFLEMFGDPVRNPKDFPLRTLGEIGKLDRGVSKHRPRNDPILLGGPYPLIQTGDVANSGGYIRSYSSTYSEAGLSQSKIWPAGTLCITIAANIAETGILTFPACFPDSVVGFTHERREMAQFVRVWLSFLRSTLERTAPTVAQKNINLQILRDLKVALPPYEMIAMFATTLEAQLRAEKSLQRAQASSDLLFSSLQHRTFSGALG